MRKTVGEKTQLVAEISHIDGVFWPLEHQLLPLQARKKSSPGGLLLGMSFALKRRDKISNVGGEQ